MIEVLHKGTGEGALDGGGAGGGDLHGYLQHGLVRVRVQQWAQRALHRGEFEAISSVWEET